MFGSTTWAPATTRVVDWRDEAACNSTGKFAGYTLWDSFIDGHPETPVEREQRWARAKAICRTCPVITDCAAAVTDDDGGVWAGTTEDERKHLR